MSAMNPVEIEATIREASNRIAKGVKVTSDAYRAFLAADHALDVAFAHAYLAADGPAYSKRYTAEIATADERTVRDEADAAYRYAERTWKALSAELDAMRSIGASVRQAYSAGGGQS